MDDNITKITIASILKPVDDTRAYEKIGTSLAQTNKYAVNIIGFETKKITTERNISFIPLYNKSRTHFKRLIAPLKCWAYYLKVKPHLIIINTPELLIVSYIYKIIFGGKLIYDVIENYQMNLAYDNTYSFWQKPLLKIYLNICEGISSWFVDHYFLAEKVYAEQLGFIDGNKSTVLENKTVLSIQNTAFQKTPLSTKSKGISFIITGTLGSSYGTLTGIKFFESVQKLLPSARLHIIGFSADFKYQQEIISACDGNEFIKLTIENSPLPHQQIIKAIQSADIALLPYSVNENLKFRFPTKFYEYAALEIPMIIPENPLWTEFLINHNAGLSINFNKEVSIQFIQSITKSTFYNKDKRSEIYWSNEVPKLLSVINKLI